MNKVFLVLIFVVAATASWANSLTLNNNTVYTLKAVVYDASNRLLGQFVINSGEATQWNDNFENFNYGTENNYQSMPPFTVNWFCMNDNPFGSCTSVAAGTVVMANSCGGPRSCPKQQQNSYP